MVNSNRARWSIGLLGLVGLLGSPGCVDVPDPAQPQPTVDGEAPGADGPGDIDLPGDADPPVDAMPDRGRDLDGGPDAAPDRGPPGDGGLDARPDTTPPDMLPPDVMPPDMSPPDMRLPDPYEGCLVPVGGQRGADEPCLRVRPVPGAQRFVHASSATRAPGGADQRVVITGGLDPVEQGGQGLRTVRMYDPQIDRWLEDVEPLPSGRWGHGTVRMTNGDLRVAGGAALLQANPEQPDAPPFWEATATVDDLPADARQWSRLGDRMEPDRSDGALVAIPLIGALYVGGTADRDGPPLSAIDVLFENGTIAPLNTSLGAARTGPMAVPMADGSLLVVGGLGRDGQAVERAERFGGSGVAQLPLPLPPVPRAFGGVHPLPDGALFVGGIGVTDGPPTTAAFRYESRYNRFVDLEPLTVPRVRPTVSAIGPDGHGWRLVVGGEAEDGQPGVVELYDPHTDRFTAYTLPAPVQRRRALHTASAFRVDGDWQVLVAGGYDPAEAQDDPAAYVVEGLRFELEVPPDPPVHVPGDCLPAVDENNQGPCLRMWRGPRLSAPRTLTAATAPNDAAVVVSGGFDPRDDTLFDTVESWLPGTRAWDTNPPLEVPRASHGMVALNRDAEPPLAALAGIGFWQDDIFEGLASVEVRAPDGLLWEMARPFSLGRVNAALVELDDQLLLIGGQSRGGPPQDNQPLPGSAPLALTERFSFGGVERRDDLNAARTRHVACVVNRADGPEAVVYGGYTLAGAIGSVETYTDEETGWVQAPVVGPALGDSTCIGGRVSMDVFGGLDAAGAPSALWQRIDGATHQITEVGRLAQPRVRPSVAAIGRIGAANPKHLVVGGDVGDGQPVVELIDRERDQRFAYHLPADVAPRQGQQAVSHGWRARVITVRENEVLAIGWRDVVVLGGQDPATGEPLDEVLVFGLDPEATIEGVDDLPGPDPIP